MGLHPGQHASHKYSVVLHSQQLSHCSFPFWNGCHDSPQNTSQGYCQVVKCFIFIWYLGHMQFSQWHCLLVYFMHLCKLYPAHMKLIMAIKESDLFLFHFLWIRLFDQLLIHFLYFILLGITRLTVGRMLKKNLVGNLFMGMCSDHQEKVKL